MIGKHDNILVYGIKPTRIHIGHTLSIFKQQCSIRNQFKHSVCLIADYHQFSTEKSYKNILDRSTNMVKLISSFGMDYYLQSDFISEYITPFFIMANVVALPLLNKIFRINYKSGHGNLVKLFYPLLQALDIMLTSPSTILVSQDQKHNIRGAIEFISVINKLLGREHFDIKYIMIDTTIRGFDITCSKMGTSNNNCIFLDASYQQVKEIVSKAKTNTQMPQTASELKCMPAVENLYNIMALLTDQNTTNIIFKYKDKGFSTFKVDLIERIYEHIENYRTMRANGINMYYDLVDRIRTNAAVIKSIS